jgi:hypothetical protein
VGDAGSATGMLAGKVAAEHEYFTLRQFSDEVGRNAVI